MCVCVPVCVYYNLFIHSSVDGLLVCFHVLAIVNSDAMNTELGASFQISFLWKYAQ